MAPRDRHEPGEEQKPGEGQEPGATEQALRALEERLGRASEAAERLIAEAAGAAARGLGGEAGSGPDEPRPGARQSGPGPHETGPGSHDPGPEPHQPGRGPHDPGPEPHQPGRGPHDPGPDESAEPATKSQPPPAGWESPQAAPPPRGERELEALIHFVGSLRDLIPPDLQRRLAEAVRELLLAVRALIDWYLERLEQRRRAPTPIEDIPIL